MNDRDPVDAARRQDDLVLLTTAAMRARRHPRALLGMWAWETALALLAAWPAAAAVRGAYGGDPSGDAPLWAPGGHALADLLWHDQHALRGVLGGAEIVLVVGAVAGLVPMAALLVAIGHATRDRQAAGFVRSLGEGLRAFGPMAVLLLVATLLGGLVVGAGAVLAHLTEAWAHPGMGEARAEQLQGAVMLPFLFLASMVGVVHDLARAAVVRFRVRGLRALALGTRTFRLAPASLWWSWMWRWGASLAPVLAAAAVGNSLGGRGGVALVFLALLHQAVVLGRVALRASWLARALRAVDGTLRRVSAP